MSHERGDARAHGELQGPYRGLGAEVRVGGEVEEEVERAAELARGRGLQRHVHRADPSEGALARRPCQGERGRTTCCAGFSRAGVDGTAVDGTAVDRAGVDGATVDRAGVGRTADDLARDAPLTGRGAGREGGGGERHRRPARDGHHLRIGQDRQRFRRARDRRADQDDARDLVRDPVRDPVRGLGRARLRPGAREREPVARQDAPGEQRGLAPVGAAAAVDEAGAEVGQRRARDRPPHRQRRRAPGDEHQRPDRTLAGAGRRDEAPRLLERGGEARLVLRGARVEQDDEVVRAGGPSTGLASATVARTSAASCRTSAAVSGGRRRAWLGRGVLATPSHRSRLDTTTRFLRRMCRSTIGPASSRSANQAGARKVTDPRLP